MTRRHSTPAPRDEQEAPPAPQERGLTLTRVSDPKQSGGSSQLTACRRLATVLGVSVAREIHDHGISGDDMEREGIHETLAELQKAQKEGRPIGWIITDQSDRLSRADSIDTSEVLARMRRLGVRKIATPSRTFDLHDKLDRTLLLLEADHKNNPYLKDLGRRALNGMLDAAREGFWTGQKPPLGYVVVRTPGEHGGRRRKSGRLAIDEPAAALVREMFKRYLEGSSTRDLCAWLSAQTGRRWSRLGVQRILTNETYTGTKAFGKRTSGRHARLLDGEAAIMDDGKPTGDVVKISGFPVIVGREQFLRVRDRLAARPGRGRRKSHPVTPLSELCVCGPCDAPVVSCRQGPYSYYVCSVHKGDRVGDCGRTNYMRCEEILRHVRGTLAAQLLEGDADANLAALAGEAEDDARLAWEAEVARARKTLEGCEARLATARRRLTTAPDDLIEDYQRATREAKDERAAAEGQLKALTTQEPAAPGCDAERLALWVESCRGVCAGGAPEAIDPALLNATLKELVKEVRVYPPERLMKGKRTVGHVEVVLPEWLSRVLVTTGGNGLQHAKSIVLTSLAPAA